MQLTLLSPAVRHHFAGHYLQVVCYLADVIQIQVLQDLDLAVVVGLSRRLLRGGGPAVTVIAWLVTI